MKGKVRKIGLSLLVAMVFILSSAFVSIGTVEKKDASDIHKVVGNNEKIILMSLDTSGRLSMDGQIEIRHVDKCMDTEILSVPPPPGWISTSFAGPDLWHLDTLNFVTPPEALFCGDAATFHYPAGIINEIILDFGYFDIDPTCYVPTDIFDIIGQMNYVIHPNDAIFPVVAAGNTWVTLSSSTGRTGSTGGWEVFSFEDWVSSYFNVAGGNNLLAVLEWAAIAAGYSLSDVNGVGFNVCNEVANIPTVGQPSGAFSGLLIDQVSIVFSYESVGLGLLIGYSGTPGTTSCYPPTYDLVFPGFLLFIDTGNLPCSFFHRHPQFSHVEGTYTFTTHVSCKTTGVASFIRILGTNDRITGTSHISEP